MEKHIVELIKRYANITVVSLDTNLYSIDITEMDVADIFMDVEEAFQVSIGEVDEYSLLTLTINEFVQWVSQNTFQYHG